VLILGGNQLAAGGYNVDNSLRFNDGSSDYLNRTPASASNRKTFTISFWVKRGVLGTNASIFAQGSADNNQTKCRFIDTDSSLFFDDEAGGTSQARLITNRVFRDVSAWFHILIAVDTTQSTSSDRIKLYVNGVQETSFATSNYPSQNHEMFINTANAFYIGREVGGGYLDGYLAEFVFIDGQQLDPTSFGEFDEDTGIWKPIDVSGLTFGTNGFYLPFENSAALGQDDSGNGNNFTVNNLTSIDQTTDTPTNNFATLNPLFTPSPSNVSTFSEGNLKVVTNSTSQNSDGLSTIGVSSGKWYAEFKLIAEATGESVCGVKTNIENPTTNGLHGTGGFCVASNGDSFNNGSSQGIGNFSASYTTNDIISVALDLDNNKVYFAKNGSWTNGTGSWNQANPTGFFTLTSSQTYFMGVGDKSTSQSSTWEANFGNPTFTISSGNSDGNGYGNFEYSIPSGYYALNSKNLAEYG
jgi:hypothetical protein